MIGSGYVGLVSGACFADFGHDVVCVDKDEGKIAAPLEGRMPIYEPGLEHLVSGNVAAGRLKFTTDLAEGVKRSEEHTSELQSLMRSSYAVFCLKQKKRE